MIDRAQSREHSLVWWSTASLCLLAATANAQGQAEVPLRIGGTGGAYILAEPGELVVDVEKRDLNRTGRRTELQAILLGPDRRVLAQATIPDDGRPRGSGLGPPQRARLATRVQRKGVCALNVTVSQDRYGDEIIWGFATNCRHYLIETARGHRDRRREEPIVLRNPGLPGDVCFLPRKAAFGIELSQLPKEANALTVFDARGQAVRSMPVSVEGKAACIISADADRGDRPWRLHLPSQQANVQIDGVTRWDRGDMYPDLPNWSPDPKSFFPLQKYRWILTPYNRLVYGRPGEKGAITFSVHNNSGGKVSVGLAIEFPGDRWPVELPTRRVVLGAKQATEVAVRYTVPAAGKASVCHIRATPEEDPHFSTYSTLTVRAGTPPAAQPLETPIRLRPYCHENRQFGYLPDHPVENQVYFDPKNRPFALTGRGVETWRDGRWRASALRVAGRPSAAGLTGRAFGAASTKIAFDRDGDLYLVTRVGSQAALLRSTDAATTFTAEPIPGRKGGPSVFDIEQFSGHNTPDGPPPLLRYTRTASDPRRIWRRINDLELFLPTKVDGRLSLGDPILISRRCIGLSAHSGIPSSVVSRGTKVHVAWAEATDPDRKVPGVPTYVATYDRSTCRLGEPALVGYGAPANDIHNSPNITMDSKGYLHVLAGTHGRPFQYVRSLKPNDANSGWTKATPVGEGLPQTYIGLVCGPDDALHLVFRLWRYGTAPFAASHHATLAYQRKRPGKPWEPPRILIVPPFSEYSIFYHRLTIDRAGRLFLSYDYWSTYWFYRTDHRGKRRALLTSGDGGGTWKLAETADLCQQSERRASQ
jgi:hypothetical protein